MGRPCCGSIPIYHDWFRPCEIHEILNTNTDVTGFTNQWEFKVFRYRNTTQTSGWQPVESILAAPFDYVNSFSDKGWIRKMAPVRYRINVPPGNQKNSLFASFPGWHAQTELCPSIDSHTVGSRIVTVDLPRIFWSPYFGSQGACSWARVVVDGVASSIASVGISRSTRYALGIAHSAQFDISVPVSAADVEVFIDVWYTFDLNAGRSTIFDGDDSSLLAHPSTNFDNGFTSRALGGATFTNGINVTARVRPADRWQMTFTGPTVGGVSSTILESQSGWTFENSFPVLIKRKDGSLSISGNGDSVTLDLSKETAPIRVVKYNGAQFLGPVWYYPADTGYYDPIIQTSIGYLDERTSPVTYNNRVVETGLLLFGHRYRTQLTMPSFSWSSFPTSISLARL